MSDQFSTNLHSAAVTFVSLVDQGGTKKNPCPQSRLTREVQLFFTINTLNYLLRT